MQIKLGVLGKGDEIFDIWDTRLVIKHKNNQIEVLDYFYDEEGMPRIKPISIILFNKADKQIVNSKNEYYLLDNGDEIFKICYDKLYIKKNSKEVEIFSIITNEEGCYLEENSIIITFGNKVVSVKKPGTDIEMGTF
jgi:hypothetical protein